MTRPSEAKQLARRAGLTRYFTGVPCKQGHLAERMTVNSDCVECLSARRVRQGQTAEYKARDCENVKRRYRTDPRVKELRKLRSRTPEYLAKVSAYVKEHAPQYIASNAKRRAVKAQAMPAWLTREQRGEIRQLYYIAWCMANIAGEPYAVDHEIPLRGDGVCGLHVPWNLQVITQRQNQMKGNRL